MRPSAWLWFVCCAACTSTAPAPVTFAIGQDAIAVRLGGAPFTEYRWRQARSPVLWPLLAPGGVPMTRAYPFAVVPGEADDHPHHQSVWFAHGDVNGVDFWQGSGHIEHVGAPVVDPSTGSLGGTCAWLAADGSTVATDERTWRFAAGDRWRAADLDLTLIASHGELRLGDTKEGTFAVRVRPELRLKGDRAAGSILASGGQRDAAVWGQRARWVVYQAPVDGEVMALAIFDHPGNPRAPTHWHARDYGLFAANPFGLHDFTGAPAGSGELRLRPGDRLRFRYRVLVHRGALDAAGLDTSWQEWVASTR